jgi:hypothetical protein
VGSERRNVSGRTRAPCPGDGVQAIIMVGREGHAAGGGGVWIWMRCSECRVVVLYLVPWVMCDVRCVMGDVRYAICHARGRTSLLFSSLPYMRCNHHRMSTGVEYPYQKAPPPAQDDPHRRTVLCTVLHG